MGERSYDRLVAEETLILAATEEICRVQSRYPGGISRSEIGRRADLSKAHVVRFLQGKGNPTLRTLADLAFALDCNVEVRLVSIPEEAPDDRA